VLVQVDNQEKGQLLDDEMCERPEFLELRLVVEEVNS
jgi:hypothetical protein